MSREVLKGLIDLVRFVPEEKALPDEIEAIKRADDSIEKEGTVSHDSINWD